jgi:hypothetical protein
MLEVWHKAAVAREWYEPVNGKPVKMREYAPLCGEKNVPWVTRMHGEDAAVTCKKCRFLAARRER